MNENKNISRSYIRLLVLESLLVFFHSEATTVDIFVP